MMKRTKQIKNTMITLLVAILLVVMLPAASFLLSGCGMRVEGITASNVTESTEGKSTVVIRETDSDLHLDRYTDEQKEYLQNLWGKEYYEAGLFNDGVVEFALLGTGYEVGHKTTGIARGFSYETENADIPESSGNKKVSYKTIAAWARKEKAFRLADTVPYQYMLKSDTKTSKFHITFPLEEGDNYTFDILGHMEENKVCIEWMMVYFHEEEYSYTYSIYENMNYIRSVLEEKKDWNQPVLNIMAGSVDTTGAYIGLADTPDGFGEYMIPDQGMLDGTVPVHIMHYNGSSLNKDKSLTAITFYYVEWNSLEHGEHELAVELQAEDGSKKQVTVPFVY